jgi:hypothetical protein
VSSSENKCEVQKSELNASDVQNDNVRPHIGIAIACIVVAALLVVSTGLMVWMVGTGNYTGQIFDVSDAITSIIEALG